MAAFDEYDHSGETKILSASGINDSVKSIILTRRMDPTMAVIDVTQLLAATMGTACHNQMERVFTSKHLPNVMRSLGYPDGFIATIRVNPDEKTASEDNYNVYLENRKEVDVNGWTISGKYDLVLNGQLHDLKTTGVFSWTKDPLDYIHQMSVYKFLNPKIVTNSYGIIDFWFKDWKAYESSKASYPPHSAIEKRFKLLSHEETEALIVNKTTALDEAKDFSQDELVPCTPKERWSTRTYQVFKDHSAKRATKNCDTFYEAQAKVMSLGYGIIKTKDSKSTKCLYCSALPTCTQGQSYDLT